MLQELVRDPVFWIEFGMLSALLTVGLYTSIWDIRTRLIPNKPVLILLICGILGQMLMIHLNVTSISQVGGNILVALGIALGLTFCGFWAPGDAKLFCTVVLALPPSLISPLAHPVSLAATPGALILNVLFCYLIVLLLLPLLQRGATAGLEQQAFVNVRDGFWAAWGLAGLLGVVIGFSLFILDRPLRYMEALAFLMLGYRLMDHCLDRKYWMAVLIPGTAILVYLGQAAVELVDLIVLWGLAIVFEVLFQYARCWVERASVQMLLVSAVQPGTVLRQEVRFPIKPDKEAGEFIFETGKVLSQEEIGALHKLAQKGELPLGDKLLVEKSIPFAPFIVAGSVLTGFFADNLVRPLNGLMYWIMA